MRESQNSSMSLKYQIMIAGVLFFSSLGLIKGQEDPDDIGDWNPNWNYTKGGDDWDFTNCNKLT
jgi:carbonic anhydrase